MQLCVADEEWSVSWAESAV